MTVEGKWYYKATVDKKVDTAVAAYEDHTNKEAQIHRTPGIPNIQLVKHEGDLIDID